METGTLRPAVEVRMESRNSRGFGSAVGAPGPLPGVSKMFPMTALESLEKITNVGGGRYARFRAQKDKTSMHEC